MLNFGGGRLSLFTKTEQSSAVLVCSGSPICDLKRYRLSSSKAQTTHLRSETLSFEFE